MASKKINGITIAIDADTSGVTAGLKDLTTKSISLSKQLKTVDSLLKLDPTNTELLATKQKLLAESVETSRKKLQALKGAQEDVKKAVKNGSIGTDEYIAFQKEVVQTEKRLKDLEGQTDDTGDEMKQLGTETKTAGNDMEKTESKSHKLASALKSGVAAAAKAATAALAATAAAAGATGAAIIKLTNDFADRGDEIDKNSQKLGLSAEAYQEWDHIMQHAGSDVDKMSTSMKKLATAVQSPTKKTTAAFEKLGISMEEAKELSQEDLFKETITALQKMESGTERTALANELLGKSAMDLGALLNMSADETEAMRQQLHDLGAIMDTDAIEASAAYKDSLQDMKAAISGVKNGIIGDFLPPMIQMMNSLTQLATGNEAAIEGLTLGAKRFVTTAEKNAKKVVKIVEKILPVIGKALEKATPKLLKWAGKAIKSLVSYIYDNREEIVKTAFSLVSWLAEALGKALPKLIPAAVKIVAGLAETLLDNLPTLIDGAIKLLRGLADGIMAALPILLEKLPEIFGKIIDAITDAFPKLLEFLGELAKKLWDFISNPENQRKIFEAGQKILMKLLDGIRSIKKSIHDFFDNLLEKIFEKLGLGQFYRRGKAIIDNIKEGMENAWKTLKGTIDKIANYASEKLGVDKFSIFKNILSGGTGSGIFGLYGKYKMAKGLLGFAQGGVINTPTRALIGENGAEAVMPLEHNTGWIDKLAARINRTGGGYSAQITVNVYGDNMGNIGDKIAAKIDTALRRYQVQQTRGQGGTAWAT